MQALLGRFLTDPEPIYTRADRALARARELHDRLLDPEALREATDEDLGAALVALYRQSTVTPLFSRSIPRQVPRLRAGLLNLIAATEDLAPAIDALLQPDGAYYVRGLGRSFYSRILQALKPGEAPAMTPEIEAGLRALGLATWPEKVAPGTLYQHLWRQCTYLRETLKLRDVLVVEQFLEYAANHRLAEAAAPEPDRRRPVPPAWVLTTESAGPETPPASEDQAVPGRVAEIRSSYTVRLPEKEPAAVELPAQIFTPDTFAFFSELHEHNTREWFASQVDRFEQTVAGPLRALVEYVGQTIITPLDPLLVTEPSPLKTLSRLSRNRYGQSNRAPYYDYLWAAFYREGRTRHTDAQLLIYISASGIEVGFHVGRRAWQALEQFHQNVSQQPQLFLDLLQALPFQEELVISGGSDLSTRQRIELEDFEDVLGLVQHADVRLVRHFPATDPRVSSADFALLVAETLRAVYPLYLFATRPDIVLIVSPYLVRDGDSKPELRTESRPLVSGPHPSDLEAFRSATLLPPEKVNDLLALLADKRQVILYGPPGTGKTFIARQLARLWAGTVGEVRLVQFHPSFSYEEFIEGIRPHTREVNGRAELVYEVEDGVFKNFCRQARAALESRHVLIIDEINRGDIARIFGELLFLLEYRHEKVELPYSRQSFNIPANVYLVGTMNTADRSIAVVDQALRRRFHFVPFYPDPELLARWLERQAPEMVWVADLLAALNRLLAEDGVEPENWLGHSYFMVSNLTPAIVGRIWTYSLKPVLAEIFYNQPGRLAKYEQLVQNAPADSSGS